MKISYYDAFDFFAEEALEILYQDGIDDEMDAVYSSETTFKEVMYMIENDSRPKRKRVSWKIRFLLAAVFLLLMSTISFGFSERGAELIDEFNKHLVGKEDEGESKVIDENEKYTSVQKMTESTEEIWKTSTVIRKVEKGMMSPNTITEFALNETEGNYITPEIMFDNGDMVIFTKQDGSGWHLEKGECLIYEVEEYESEIGMHQGQTIGYYQIYDGIILQDPVEIVKTLEQKIEMVAEKSGEYFFCLIGYSSDRISLKKGKITVIDSQQ